SNHECVRPPARIPPCKVIRNSLKNERPLFMFKGWLPARPTTILIFLTLEQLKRAVDWTRGDLK
ncbi:hypothetical protein DFH11DRAFT_1581852, partial [Phellopilus nigrolimitatus]